MTDSEQRLAGTEVGTEERDVERYLVDLIRPETRSYAARAGMAQRSVGALLAAVGDPQRRLRVIYLAGSKGKGSTALLLEALLEQAGLRTATFTSPHLERWTERLRIAGREVAVVELAGALERLRPTVETLASADADTAPSFFEVLTAAAYLLFAEAGAEVAIIEAGLGARFDATNVVTPLVSVITGIEMEHADKLGPALVDIARHKAGAIKPGIPVVCGRLPPVARLEIHAEAKRLGAPLFGLGRDFQLEAEARDDGLLSLRLQIAGADMHIPTALRAPHLARNAALAIAATLASGLVERERLAALATTAFATVSLPGRVELLGSQPWLVVDGAHTTDSARELASALRGMCSGPRVLLLSLSGTKQAMPLLAPLMREVNQVVVTRAEPLRSRDPHEVMAELCRALPGLAVECVPDPEQALVHALRLTPPEGLLCATGSMYAAGFARRLLREGLARRAAA